MAASRTAFGVGASLKRKEDAAHPADAVVSCRREVPEMQDVAFVRSPHAHARIKGIVVLPAYSRCVFTARDPAAVAELGR